MAKPKHSTALFEVIAKHGGMNGNRAGFMGTMARWLHLRPREASSEPADALPAAPGDPMSEGADARACGPLTSPAASARFGVMEVDGERGEISLRMSYTSAIICVFAIITLVGVAFIAGRKTVLGPRPAFAGTSTPQLRAQPPATDILRLPRTRVDVPPVVDGNALVGGQAPAEGQQNAAQGPRDRVRVKGLNYVIIQSYPVAEEGMANEAVKALTENGIDCTIETKLKGWGSWHVIVGLEGFDKITGSPRYPAYLRRIREISDKYAKKNSFKAFAPTPFLWGKQG